MAIVDGLVTLADVRKSLGLASTDTTNDTDIERYIEAATPTIENIVGPLIQRSRVFTFDGGSSTVVVPVRFASVTSVVESGATITDFVTDLQAATITAGATDGVRDFAYGYQNIVVTVVVGAATVPANVQLAARELVRFWWQQGRQANIPAFGEAPESMSTPMGFAVPKRVLELLEPNKRIAGFA
jgi:hypothetical protein